MADIGTLKTWVPFEVPLSADMNANFAEIKSKFNTYGLQAGKAIAGDLIFTDALYDIGKTGATRPRDGFFSRDVTADTYNGITSFKLNGTAIISRSGNDVVFADYLNGIGRAYITSLGTLNVGTTLTTGAAAGDVVLANSKWLRGVNTAASSAVALISLQGADQVQVAPNSVLIIGQPASQANSANGEVVLANSKTLRAATIAGNDTFALIHGDANNAVRLAGGGQMVGVGVLASFTGATGGDLVFANNRHMRANNAAGTAAKHVIGLTNLDVIYIGIDSVGPIAIGVPGSLTGATISDVVLVNGKALREANNANSAAVRMIELTGATDAVLLGGGGGNVIAIGAPASLTGAAAGEVVVANNKWYMSVNAGGTAAVGVIRVNSSDQLELNAGSTSLKILNPLTATTVGAAGGGSALPATPIGYWRVQLGASVVKIPYFTD